MPQEKSALNEYNKFAIFFLRLSITMAACLNHHFERKKKEAAIHK